MLRFIEEMLLILKAVKLHRCVTVWDIFVITSDAFSQLPPEVAAADRVMTYTGLVTSAARNNY